MITISNCICRHSRISLEKPTHAIILLPGRNNSAEMMMDVFSSIFEISRLVVYSIQPENEWYPIPNGIDDQVDAVNGLDENISSIRDYIFGLLKKDEIKTENTILIGFSAGAVVALELLTKYQDNFSLVVCHSGAILLPDEIKKAETTTEIMLFHRKDDYCFDWNERYLPMKMNLEEKGYNINCHESSWGNHLIYKTDIETIYASISNRVVESNDNLV